MIKAVALRGEEKLVAFGRDFDYARELRDPLRISLLIDEHAGAVRRRGQKDLAALRIAVNAVYDERCVIGRPVEAAYVRHALGRGQFDDDRALGLAVGVADLYALFSPAAPHRRSGDELARVIRDDERALLRSIGDDVGHARAIV